MYGSARQKKRGEKMGAKERDSSRVGHIAERRERVLVIVKPRGREQEGPKE